MKAGCENGTLEFSYVDEMLTGKQGKSFSIWERGVGGIQIIWKQKKLSRVKMLFEKMNNLHYQAIEFLTTRKTCWLKKKRKKLMITRGK